MNFIILISFLLRKNIGSKMKKIRIKYDSFYKRKWLIEKGKTEILLLEM